MKNLIEDLIFSTTGKGMFEITENINDWISKNSINQGQLNIFINHTSALLTIIKSAISIIPFLIPCSSSPPEGNKRTIKISTIS